MKPTLELLLGVMGLRRPNTAVTAAELDALCILAAGAHSAVEVGVAEGATSAQLLGAMDHSGVLYLVDPYPARLRLEGWLGWSGTKQIALRSVRRFGRRARFVNRSSVDAATDARLPTEVELVFLDAAHDYDSVLADLRAWAPRVAPGGAIAVHDARICAGRPELATGAGGPRAVSDWIFESSEGWRLEVGVDSLAVIRRVAQS